MSRISDTERGARIAERIANKKLAAHFSPSLFPERMKPAQVRFWETILGAASDQVNESEFCRGVSRA